jgi:hypothetical protein
VMALQAHLITRSECTSDCKANRAWRPCHSKVGKTGRPLFMATGRCFLEQELDGIQTTE